MKYGRCDVDYSYFDVGRLGTNSHLNYYNRKSTTGRPYQWYENTEDGDVFSSDSDSTGGSGDYGDEKYKKGKPCRVPVKTFASYKVCVKGRKVQSIECRQEVCEKGRCQCPW